MHTLAPPSLQALDVLPSVPTGLFVGGRWRPAAGGATFDVEDPATGRTLLAVADAAPEDAVAALDAAAAAQESWATIPARERAEILRRAFDDVTARAEEFALLITLEMGKSLAEARAEVGYGAEFLRWFSEEAARIHGRFGAAPEGTSRLLVTKKPVGPCLLITPWNFPLAMATRKIAPALAAGCTVVLKPAELTPLTSLLLGRVLQASGVPDGVLNVVPTTEAAQVTGPLLRDPRLRKLSFTGSTAVGRALIEASAPNVLRTSMELGGNAPFVVFEDADLDEAVAGAMAAKLRNAGQACTAANRFLIHESVAWQFSQRLAQEMAAAVVGPGTGPDTTVGPLVDARARNKVRDLVTSAVAEGATALTGGEPVGELGCFYAPTVLSGVRPGMRILQEEIFGPVAPVMTFSTEDEAVALANDTEYGLAAYIYTADIDRALQVGERIECGMVGLNTGVLSNAAAPFGGTKQSGAGREGGPEGIDEYLCVQYFGLPAARHRS